MIGQAAPLTAIISLLSVVSLIFLANSLAFDSARWRAGERLVQLGAEPDEIDAGYEWVGFFQPVLPAARDFVATQTLYEDLWPGRRECGIVSSSTDGLPPAALVGTETYSLFLVTGPEETVYLYRMIEPACLPASGSKP